MTLTDIETAFEGRRPMAGTVNATALVTLSAFTDISLKMDEKNLSYYYSLDVEKLMKSDATVECLSDLTNDGWSLSKDKKHIIKYIKNIT